MNPNSICDVDHVLTEVSFCEEKAIKITKIFLAYGANINGADEDNDLRGGDCVVALDFFLSAAAVSEAAFFILFLDRSRFFALLVAGDFFVEGT